MNSFEAIGEARLRAAEGQQALAALIARRFGRALLRALDFLAKHIPENKTAPW